MRLVDTLKARKSEIVERMTALDAVAERENRVFTEAETSAWNALKDEATGIVAQITQVEERDAMLRADQTVRPIAGGPRLLDEAGNVVRALRREDKLVDALPRRDGSNEPVSLARALRGVVLGDWRNATRIERAMGEGVLAGGGYAVPSELSAMWLDNARSASVCLNELGAITIPMSSSTLRIVRVDGDPLVHFRQEHAAIGESDLVFNAVDLKARTAGILCRASIELLEDSAIANAAIEKAMAGAMGLAFDKAMLAGDGNVTSPNDNPTGLLYAANVGEIATVGALADYNKFIDAHVMVLNANGQPTGWALGPNAAGALWKSPTGLTSDKTQLPVPTPIAELPRAITTSLNDQKVAGESAAIVGQWDMLGLALRTSLTLEASRTAADVMSKVEVLIRLYARIDVAILRPKFFTRLLGITAT
jgi:HK97 family phage major capsid protein